MTRRNLISAFLLLIITAAVFTPSLFNGFTNWDDPMLIIENPAIRDLSPGGLVKIMTTPDEQYYRPLRFLSYAVEYHFFKLNPFIYHFDNLMLHLLNTLLVFWLIYLLTGSGPVSFLTALLFGVHPLHVEAVAWASTRGHLLYAFFFLLSLISYLTYRKTKKTAHLVFSLILFCFSLISKIMAVTLPFILLLFDYLLEGRINKQRIKEKIPYFAIAFAFGLITILVHHFGRITEKMPDFSLLDRFFINSYAIVFYLIKLVVPLKLACFYPVPEKIGGFLPIAYLLSPVVLLLILIAVFLSGRYTRKPIFGLLFFLTAVLPTFQVVPWGIALFADRYTYIPCVGLFYLVGEAAVWLYDKQKNNIHKILLIVGSMVIIGVFCVLTWQRCLVWKDSLTLWGDDIAKYPNVLVAYYNRSQEYLFAKKNYAKSMADLDQVLRIDPAYTSAYVNRGLILFKEGKFRESVADYDRAIKLDPGNVDAYFNRGLIFAGRGDSAKALLDYDRAVQLNPYDPESFNSRGDIYFKLGRTADALLDFERAIRLAPDYAEAYYNRAVVFYSKEEFGQAYLDAQKAAALGYPVDRQMLESLRRSAGR